MMKNKTTFFSIFPVLSSAVLLLVTSYLFTGCYTLTQGTAMLGYLNRAVLLESLLESGAETEDAMYEAEKNRRFVELVQDIRRFITDELGLNLGKNYSRYVSLDRNYLAAVVSASAADSFSRHEWKFPIVGAMPYKGFFNVEDARRERAKLEKKGLDVWIRGVDAFSTLGWFRDPLFSYMRDYSPGRLADLLIHESVHATVFIRGQVQFNEEFAEFIGSEGARLYIESRFGADSDEYRELTASDEDNARFVAFIQELAAELEIVYQSSMSRDEKLIEKERIIEAAKVRFDDEYESRFSSDNYRGFSSLPVNNAYIELFRLYHAEDNFIANLYERSGKTLPEFIAAAKTMPQRGRALRGRSGREMLAQALGLEL